MLRFLFNFPYTLIFIFFALISIPLKLKFDKKHQALIINVKSFWWASLSYMKKARAMTFGHTIILGPDIKTTDLNHEFTHVRQFDRWPIIFPILYGYERILKGKQSKYEK